MKYYKRKWNESRADAYDYWGKSIWYFCVDPLNGITKEQVEIYENGISLFYSEKGLIHDDYGGLAEIPFEINEWVPFEISKDEYENIKKTSVFKNA